MTQQHEPASVVAARQLAMEAHEGRRRQSLVRSRSGASRVAAARARRDGALDWAKVPAAS